MSDEKRSPYFKVTPEMMTRTYEIIIMPRGYGRAMHEAEMMTRTSELIIMHEAEMRARNA